LHRSRYDQLNYPDLASWQVEQDIANDFIAVLRYQQCAALGTVANSAVGQKTDGLLRLLQ
jgi:hypothetical protein